MDATRSIGGSPPIDLKPGCAWVFPTEGISPMFQQVGVLTGQPSLDFGSRPMSDNADWWKATNGRLLGLDSAVRFRFSSRPSFQVWGARYRDTI